MLSKRVALSYALDWLTVIAIGLAAYGFYTRSPAYHAFSVYDPNLSYPYIPDTVTIAEVVVAAVIVPAIVIFIAVALLVPGPSLVRKHPWTSLLRWKLWELNVGWLGLALAVVTAIMITEGLKNFGKPRPSALARCMPNLDLVSQYRVGGYGADDSASVLVDVRICQQTDQKILHDAFQSWPSGHSSMSTAGLLYITLFLCAKLSVGIPRSFRQQDQLGSHSDTPLSPSSSPTTTDFLPTTEERKSYPESQLDFGPHIHAAAPPILLLLLTTILPLGGAAYICLSRYMNNAHAGFDILSGAVIGLFCAWFSFRLYHPSLMRGNGFAWTPRSPGRAFGVGVGMMGYVSRVGKGSGRGDMEMGSGGIKRASDGVADGSTAPINTVD